MQKFYMSRGGNSLTGNYLILSIITKIKPTSAYNNLLVAILLHATVEQVSKSSYKFEQGW